MDNYSLAQIYRTAPIVFLLSMISLPVANGMTIAIDDAAQPAYADGWQSGDDGGTGFQPWTLAFSGDPSSLFHPPHFIDVEPLPGNTLGAPAFALTTSNRVSFTDTSEAHRTFDVPLRPGQTISVDVDGSNLDSVAAPFSIGNTIDLFALNNSKRFTLFTNNQYHNNNWTSTGNANTGVPAATAFHFEFTLVTADTYNLELSPIGGGEPYFSQQGAALAGTSGIALNRVRFSNYGTGSAEDGSKEFFFTNLHITDSNLGDFNSDGLVNAADYVVWRKLGLADEARDLWQATFGQSATVNGLQSNNVPEPDVLAFRLAILMGCLKFVGRNRKRDDRRQAL